MKTKIIGSFVILFGILMLAGMVYIYFFSAGSFSDFAGKLLPGNEPVVTDDTGDDFKIITKDITDQPGRAVTPDKRVIEALPIDTVDIEEDDGKVAKDELIRMSGSFAERFGSYSNQSNFANILDLKIFMSERMKYWADSFILEQNKRNSANNDIYYGITTKSIAKEMRDYDEDIGLATVLVQTRRREATGASSNYSNIYNQDIMITFIKENGAWKVDSANWID